MVYLTVMLGFLFFAAVAMTVNEGMWNNGISLLCVTLSGLLGVVAGVPFGTWIHGTSGAQPGSSWYFVLGGIWGIFAFSIILLGLAMKFASGVRMRFHPLAENIGGPIIGIFVAVMLTSFTAYTLIHVPVKAGEWQVKSAAGWQVSTFEYARAPFWNALKNFVEAEEADAEFYEFDKRGS